MTYRSKKRKQKNNIEIREEFVDSLLPGICKESKSPEENWIKYIKLAIAVCRLAEYDYLSSSKKPDWKTAKALLFGSQTIFTTICRLLEIDIKMARMKLIAFKRAKKYGDPLFESISDEFIDKYSMKLSPTSGDIEVILEEKSNGRNTSRSK